MGSDRILVQQFQYFSSGWERIQSQDSNYKRKIILKVTEVEEVLEEMGSGQKLQRQKRALGA